MMATEPHNAFSPRLPSTDLRGKESDTVHSRKSVLFAELASTSSKVSVDPDQVALQQDLNEYGAKLFGSRRL